MKPPNTPFEIIESEKVPKGEILFIRGGELVDLKIVETDFENDKVTVRATFSPLRLVGKIVNVGEK